MAEYAGMSALRRVPNASEMAKNPHSGLVDRTSLNTTSDVIENARKDAIMP